MRVRLTPSVCLSAANLRRFSSADSATGGTDFKRPSKREVLFLHHRNLIKTFDLPPRRGKTAKELPLRGRGACRPLCGRQASGTPKVWHGAAVTEGVSRAFITEMYSKFRICSFPDLKQKPHPLYRRAELCVCDYPRYALRTASSCMSASALPSLTTWPVSST